MRNLMILAALFVLASGQLRAQITTYHDTLPDGTILTLVDSSKPPIEVMIDSVFGSLDFSDVSTGLLMDRTIHFVDYTRYDGTLSDSNQVDYRTFLSLYASLYSAPLDTSARPLPDLPAYKATAEDVASSGVVPVGAILMHYHRIKPTALADELLALNGIQLQDVPGRPESPYLEGRIFAVAPLRTRFEQAGLTFQFPASLYYSNSGLTLTDIEFDPGNGVGFRHLSPGESYSAIYPDSGSYLLQFRYHYSNDSIFESRGEIEIMTGATYRYANTADATVAIAATTEHDGATLSISYGCGHSSLTKPFIVVEGLNPNREIGRNVATYRTFLNNVNAQAGVILQPLLEEEGYDLVYVDYENGGDFIERNAKLVEDVIDWVNAQKASQPNAEENVVMGRSMGGLVARVALRTMENNNEDHDTRLFITQDSPHQGCYIPLGLLYTFTHLYHMRRPFGGAYLRDDKPEISQAYGAIYAPATRQMLVQFPLQQTPISNLWPDNPNWELDITYPDSTWLKSTPFLQWLDSLGHPQQCRVVAIANGSGEGQEQDPGFGPNDPINWISISENFGAGPYLFGGTAYVNTRASGLPDRTSALSQIYRGNFLIFYNFLPFPLLLWHNCSSTRIRVANTDPYETAPGSIFDPADLGDNTEGLGTVYQDRWHFVSVSSALDLDSPENEDLFYPVNPNNILNPANPLTPFKNYTAPTSVHATASLPEVNELHTQFTLSNEPFFIREMVGATLSDPVVTGSSDELLASFNFGRSDIAYTSTYISSDVRIVSGRTLGIQRAVELGVTGSGLGQASSDERFEVTVLGSSECSQDANATVSIENGLLEIGSASGNRQGVLRFASQGGNTSTLIVNSTLRIHDNSRLVIEPGATLRIENDAHIELLGDNAVLEIRGNLELGAYASLSFTGSGFIRLGMAVQGTTNVQLIGTGQRLELHGSGPTDKVLEIMDFTAWYPDYDIDMTIITDGKVELGAGAWLDTGNGQVIFANTHFTAITPDAAHRYHTIYTNGQSNQFLENLEFSWGIRGLSARNNLSNGASPTIWDSQFHDCTTGLYSEGKGLTLNNVALYNNTTGWQGVGHTFGGNFVNSQANTNGAGIFFTGNSNLTLTTSQVNNNGSGVYYSGTGSVTGSCGEVRDNFSYGILAVNNGSVNFSSQKKMNLSGNAPSISLSQASNLYLSNGRNNLIPASGSKAVNGTLSGSITLITATRNQWNTRIPPGNPIPNPGQSPVSGLDYTLTNGSGAAVTLTDNQPFVFAPCGGGNPSGLMVETEPCTNCPTMQTPHVPGLRLDLALNQALANLADSLPAVRAMGVTQLSEILDHAFPYGVNHPRLRRLLDLGWLELRDYTAREMAADTLPVDSSLHTPLLTGRLALLRAAVNRRRLQHQAAGDSVRAFYLATDRALLYEWAGRTGKALQQLENLQSPNRTPEEQEYLDHWICHLRAKQQYRQGLLTPLQWDSLIQTCPLPSAVSPVASGTALRLSAPAEPEIILYPNPATDRLYISYTPVGIPDDHASLRATLHDLQGGEEGEILPSQGVFAGNNEWEVSTAHLPAGVYLVRIFTGAESQTFKLVIVR